MACGTGHRMASDEHRCRQVCPPRWSADTSAIPLRTAELAQKKISETHPEYVRWHTEQKEFAEKNGFRH